MSCRNARSALKQRGEIQERDIFKHPLSEVELRALAAKAGSVSELFSWKSPTARKMGLKQGTLAEPEMLRLMQENAALIRRPIVLAGEEIQVGFGKAGLTV
ncbi:MAG: arsenate reductase family protein [Chloroflexota bacterium]